ncbi:MAG: phosphoglucosamine mutase [Gemmataceae bacterium]|nr:phosphoglucosamine mutase [Gemmataceae bacterium]
MVLISVSGVRGVVGEDLTAEIACRYAGAFAATLGEGPILVSRDTRPSGLMFRHAVLAGLLQTGVTVLDAGLLPTPTCGFAVRQYRAAGAIQITASHNPPDWNGLKLFGPDGAVLAPDLGELVRQRYQSAAIPHAAWNQTGTVRVPPDAGNAHLEAICDIVGVAAIVSRQWRVLLDANGGVGGVLGRQLLEQLGCQVSVHGGDMDGQFLHPPEPTPAHLAEVAPWVVRNQADVGFALDPDADRLALIDPQGDCLSEELTLALAVEWRLRQQKGPVVINMSTSRLVEDIARRHGCPCFRAPVGEAHVVAGMRAVQAVIGGEGNGGVIDPRIGWVRDPFVAMAAILDLLATEHKSLPELVAALPRYHMLKTRLPLPAEHLDAAYTVLRHHWPTAACQCDDGLRLDHHDWWLHLRPSNTEPIVRLIVESTHEQLAHELLEQVRQLLRPLNPDNHESTAQPST